jgi:zinc transport system ATP-binding protein
MEKMKIMEIIKCENLCMCYENNAVFCNLSFTLNSGDFLSVVGENGSGKSTLVKGILGLKKHNGALKIKLRRNRIGYLPQQAPAAADFPVTAGEIVQSGCLNSMGLLPFYKERHRKKAREAMLKMRVSELEGRRFRDLSGGQRQRVLIARALCAADELLLLDEPANGLDPVVRGELYELISGLNRDSGMAIIMVTHDLNGAVENSGKILHISDKKGGNFFGSTAEYKQTDFYREMRCGCDSDNN